MSGYIYVARNRSIQGLVKVGYTTRTVTTRMAELNNTGVPGVTEAVYHAYTDDPSTLERRVHAILARHRETQNREFFNVSAVEARRVIRTASMDYNIRIKNEWSDMSLDGEDNALLLAQARADLERYQEQYDQYMEDAVSINPFKRGDKIAAQAKLRSLAALIENAQDNITYCELMLSKDE